MALLRHFFRRVRLFGGAVWAAGMLAGTQGVYGAYVPVSWRALVLSFGICYAAVSLLFRRTLAKRSRHIASMEVTLEGRAAALRALEDTGNALADPVSGRPVIVADAQALAPLLGVNIPPATPRARWKRFRGYRGLRSEQCSSPTARSAPLWECWRHSARTR